MKRKQYDFRRELTQSFKIKDINTFVANLRNKLKNPIFQASLLFSRAKFRRTPFGGDDSILPESTAEHTLSIILIKLLKEKQLLNRFCILKEMYEIQVLKGEYTKAIETVEDVKRISGLSCWYIESKFALLAKTENYSEFERFYNELVGNTKSDIEKRDIDLIFDRTSPKSIAERVIFSLDSLKEGLIQEDAIDAHVVDFLHRFNAAKKYDSTKILSYFWQSNIIDIYNILCRLIFSGSIDNSIIDLFDNQLIELAKSVNSYKLKNYFKVHFHNEINKELEQKFVEICDAYISGNYKYCISLCEELLEDKPNISSIYEFYCNSLLNEGWIPSLKGDGILKELIVNHVEYNSNNDNSSKKLFLSFNNLDSIQFISLRNEKKIISFSESNVKAIENVYSFFECTVTPNNPFNIKIFIDGSLSSGITHGVYQDSHEGIIPDYRIRKRLADKLFHEKKFDEAINTYIDIENYPIHMKSEISNKIILSYFSNQQIDQACRYICKLFFKDELNIDRLDCKQILDILEECEPVDIPIVEIPIGLYLLTDKKESHTIALYLDDYLDYLGVFKPSEINIDDDKHKFMLHKVCNLDVLESLHIIRKLYPSSNDRMLDRTLILSKLKTELLYKTEEISNELDFLQHQFSRNLCITDAGPGKININSEMIAEIFKTEKSQIINSLEQAYNLENKTFVFEMEAMSSQVNNKLFTSGYEFFMALRDIYTLDPKYGLDYQLNTNIRHNGIVPALRSIFEIEGLICNHENGVYKDNVKFESISKSILIGNKYEELQEEIKNFSKRIDTRINKLKSVYMHVATNDKDDKDKLFKVTIDEADIYKLLVYLDSGNSVESCITYCLGVLNNKSEESLKVGRALINGEKNGLYTVFEKELHTLALSLKGHHCTKYLDAISITKNELKSRLDSISDWLNFAEYSAENFLIEAALYEAKSFVDTIFCTAKVDLIINNSFNKKLDGQYLMSFINIFILVFENACKRRKFDDIIEIIVTTSLVGNYLNVEISNLSKSIDKEIIKRINSDINDVKNLHNANKENNSGIYKVKKSLELDMRTENEIKVDYSGDEFIFNVKMNMLGIIGE
ncbi:hypothetical protein [Aliivibrio fischeri]|nr:hypothetical protein [Aliivibrio fischeri]